MRPSPNSAIDSSDRGAPFGSPTHFPARSRRPVSTNGPYKYENPHSTCADCALYWVCYEGNSLEWQGSHSLGGPVRRLRVCHYSGACGVRRRQLNRAGLRLQRWLLYCERRFPDRVRHVDGRLGRHHFERDELRPNPVVFKWHGTGTPPSAVTVDETCVAESRTQRQGSYYSPGAVDNGRSDATVPHNYLSGANYVSERWAGGRRRSHDQASLHGGSGSDAFVHTHYLAKRNMESAEPAASDALGVRECALQGGGPRVH